MENHELTNYIYVSGLDESLKTTLAVDYGIQELDIEDVFTNTQLSKNEQRKHYLFVALQFPEYNKIKRHFEIKEIYCFINSKHLLVIDKNNFKHLKQFNNFKDNLVDQNINSFNLFYEMLDFLVTKAFKVLSKFRQEIADVEIDIFDFENNKDLLIEILITKRNLINFVSIINPLETVIYDLQHKYNSFIDTEGREKLDDSLDKIKKILNNLHNFKEQMMLLNETNEAQIARSTNETIKTLTVMNIIVLIPTILASFFGMNVYFGWDNQLQSLIPLIFITLFMIALTTVTYFYFRKKRWV